MVGVIEWDFRERREDWKKKIKKNLKKIKKNKGLIPTKSVTENLEYQTNDLSTTTTSLGHWTVGTA
jgi:hypothetical protein